MSYQFGSSGGSFAPDRTWGTVFIVLYALMLAAALVVVFLIGAVATFATSSSHGVFPKLAFGAFAGVLGFVLVVTLGAHIVAAVGVHKGRAWGFWATIALSVLSLASSSGGTCLTIVPLIYCIVRLSGSYGPKPQ